MFLTAISFGGKFRTNWTSEDSERGFKLIGDIAYKAPSLKDLITKVWGTTNKWANGRVPFKMSSSLSSSAQSTIRTAMQMLSSRVDNCVQFVDKTSTDINYVDIIPNLSGCYSYVGDIKSGGQELALDESCQKDKGTIMHELMHALGFHHEQSRADRDSYVKIDFTKLPGQQDQYNKEIGQAYTTPYDYQSLMHYPASEGMYAINPVGAAIPGSWYRADNDIPSKIDIQGIKAMYCSSVQTCTEQTCNGGGTCSSTSTSYTCKCDPGFNGVDCANKYFTCPRVGTFADPLYCYKYIFCTTINGVLTTKTSAITECPIVANYQLLYDETLNRCVFPQLYTKTTNCALTRA